MQTKIPSAKALARISSRTFKVQEHVWLTSDLYHYQKDIDKLVEGMHEHAANGYSVLTQQVYLPESVLSLFRKNGYEATCYARRDTGKHETEISWYGEEKELA